MEERMDIIQLFFCSENGFKIGQTVITDDGKVGKIIRSFDEEYRVQLKDGSRFWVNRQHLKEFGEASQTA
jgi:hypothetical protein